MSTVQVKNMSVQFLFCIFILFSCKNDTLKNNISATEYFPNKIGNYWEYSVYDSSQIREHPSVPRQYLVKIKIIGIKKLVDNKDAMLWNYEYPWGNETIFYRAENDSIKVYDNVRAANPAFITYPNDLFIYPLFDGQKWKSNLLWTDSFFVSKDNISNYHEVFKIHRGYIGQQTYYQNDYWFSPKIGILKKYRNEVNQGIRTNELWQLNYYNLK